MELTFRGKHLTIGDDFRGYASKKLARLTRYLPLVDQAVVDLRREGKSGDGRFVVQITLNANGTFLRAEERSHQLMAALDTAVDTLSEQVKRFKRKKLYRSLRRATRAETAPAPEEPELPPDAEIVSGRVVKVKRFELKPMTEAEAIGQMELLGHSFFLFRDADRDTFALLYRRRDGDYGMILPDSP